MRELAVRAYLLRADLGDRRTIDSAAILVAEVDNPALRARIQGLRAAVAAWSTATREASLQHGVTADRPTDERCCSTMEATLSRSCELAATWTSSDRVAQSQLTLAALAEVAAVAHHRGALAGADAWWATPHPGPPESARGNRSMTSWLGATITGMSHPTVDGESRTARAPAPGGRLRAFDAS